MLTARDDKTAKFSSYLISFNGFCWDFFQLFFLVLFISRVLVPPLLAYISFTNTRTYMRSLIVIIVCGRETKHCCTKLLIKCWAKKKRAKERRRNYDLHSFRFLYIFSRKTFFMLLLNVFMFWEVINCPFKFLLATTKSLFGYVIWGNVLKGLRSFSCCCPWLFFYLKSSFWEPQKKSAAHLLE